MLPSPPLRLLRRKETWPVREMMHLCPLIVQNWDKLFEPILVSKSVIFTEPTCLDKWKIYQYFQIFFAFFLKICLKSFQNFGLTHSTVKNLMWPSLTAVLFCLAWVSSQRTRRTATTSSTLSPTRNRFHRRKTLIVWPSAKTIVFEEHFTSLLQYSLASLLKVTIFLKKTLTNSS